jgi:hypothetical protein
MVPFACIHCRAKRIKTNSTIENEKKKEKKKEIVGDLKGPLAREPYGPPDPRIARNSTHGQQSHSDIKCRRQKHTTMNRIV